MPNLIGKISVDGTLRGIISNATPSLKGYLSNATLRGIPVELRIDETVLQWKYLDSDTWTDLIDLNDLDYEQFQNLPQINDVILTGNKTSEDLNLASRSEGITSITRNGTTFTVTRPDGTTFTFDQQDNDTTYEEATESNSGLMSSEDKTKLDNIQVGSQANIIESISVNGVTQTIDQNKNVNLEIITDVDDTLTESGVAADAKATGDALDSMINNIQRVANAIPTNVSELNNDSNYINKNYVDTELAKKQDTLTFGVPTSEDIGKALMPKTVENGVITEWEFGEAGMVDDVQINGTSIVQDKTANIPIASSSNLGVVGIPNGVGIGINKGGIYIVPATASIKYGVNSYNPIVPHYQHESTFYGLAKIAGHDEKDSELPSGTYSEEAKMAIQSMLGVPSIDDIPEVPVKDVKINGASIVDQDGSANVPTATNASLGVVKGGSRGVMINSGGVIAIDAAIPDFVKIGTNGANPIVPGRQHMSVFYGLAKAAGADEKDSTLPVGQYTDEAKSAIQSMLGIDSAIADAVGQITSFEFQVVNELPATGTKGVIYLVPHAHDTDDIYDEYIWITDKYERLGTLDVNLSNYVTFDDYATANKPGVAKVVSTNGIYVDSNGVLSPTNPTDLSLKLGNNTKYAVNTARQHIATFYGLAKASGDTTQSESSNPVGTYTDEAKAAIQGMLDVAPSSADMSDRIAKGVDVDNNFVDGAIIAGVVKQTDLDIDGTTETYQANKARGLYSFAGGIGTSSFGIASLSFGRDAIAYGDYSSAQGQNTVAQASNTHAEGVTTCAVSMASHSEGMMTSALGMGSHAEGGGSRGSVFLTGAAGDTTYTCSNMSVVHVDDYILYLNKISRITSIDKTNNTITLSQTLGYALNSINVAVIYTYAKGNYSHTEGLATIATEKAQHAQGIYNANVAPTYTSWAANTSYSVGDYVLKSYEYYRCIEANSDSTWDATKWKKVPALGFADMVGNGSSSLRSNAYALDWSGNGYFAGDVYVGCNNDSSGGTKLATVDDIVSDVQVNGTSVTSSGVANIPKATANTLGTVMVDEYYGIAISERGRIAVVPAVPNEIKEGSNVFRQVSAMYQHQAVFYGLSKAAGVDLANEEVTLGTYPATAQTAIKSMLGVADGAMTIGTVTTLSPGTDATASITGDYSAMELNLGIPRGESGVYIGSTAPTDSDINVWIDTTPTDNPYVETITGTTVTIVGEPNCRYMCGTVLEITITPPTAGTIEVIFTSGSSPAVMTLPNTVIMPEWWEGIEANYTYDICITDGIYAGVSSWPV